jgi:hypothetical protein
MFMESKVQPEDIEELGTKMLGAQVEEDVYRKFKAVAAMRGEMLKDAVAHAAHMYIGAGGENK